MEKDFRDQVTRLVEQHAFKEARLDCIPLGKHPLKKGYDCKLSLNDDKGNTFVINPPRVCESIPALFKLGFRVPPDKFREIIEKENHRSKIHEVFVKS